MTWRETERVSEGSLLVRIGSDRKVRLLEKFCMVQKITVLYLDTREIAARVDPSDFVLPTAPAGTVARGSI